MCVLAFNGETWPLKTKLDFRGELPSPFDISPGAPALPFEVNVDELPAKGFPDAQLASPRPSLWIKWVRVFQQPPFPGEEKRFTYEADGMLAGRREKGNTRHSMGSLGRFLDENGKEVQPERDGQHGDLHGATALNFNVSDFEFAENPLEFRLWRMGWDDGYAKAAPTEFMTQNIEYGGREPLQLTIPITRGGVPLEGDIPATGWKIESPAPAN